MIFIALTVLGFVGCLVEILSGRVKFRVVNIEEGERNEIL